MFAATTQIKDTPTVWDHGSSLGGSKGEGSVAFWLSTALLIAAIGRLLCDRIADVRAGDHEWPNWVDSSRSRSSHFGQKQSLAMTVRKVRL
jgi:hypothetical protein